MSLDVGQKAPDFTAATDGGGSVTLSALAGRNVIVYFYPKDDTPGCTKEACGFRDAFPDFSAADATVIGISKDSAKSHDRFKQKYELNFTLASDPDGAICAAFGTWVEKMNYGKTYMGIQRATFLIDKEGVVRRVWRNVKVPGHVEEVLAATRAL